MKIYLLLISLFYWLPTSESAEILITPTEEKFVKSVGSALLFTCSVVDVDEGKAVSIQWLDNHGVEILETYGRRFVEDEEETDTKMLYLTSIEVSDAGDLTCRVSVEEDSLEKSVKLEVFEDLKITANETQTPILNSDALISCQVSGDPNFRVSWKKDGKRLLGSRYRMDKLRGLTIEQVTEADNGVYTCNADIRKLGLMRSKKINVLVHVPPRITLEKSSVEILETEKVILKCSATGVPKPIFSFSKGDEEDVLESNVNLLIDEVEGTLELPIAQQDDSGVYICTASNDAGQDKATIILSVLVPPRITEFLPVSLNRGEEGSLTCKMEGVPRPEVVFSKTDGSNSLADEMPDRFTLSEDGDDAVLTIHSVEAEDTGTYICTAKNSAGEDSLDTLLTVKYIPIISKAGSDFEYNWVDHSVIFTCEADGIPPPYFSWVKFNDDLFTNDTYTIYDTNSSSLLEVKVTEKDQGWIFGEYHCIVSNDLGEVTRDFTMKRAITPSVPMLVSLVEAHPTMIVIDISPPESDGGIPVETYLVEYQKNKKEKSTDCDSALIPLHCVHG